MFITLRDVSKGKPLSLNKSIESCKQIGIRAVYMWVGWYNMKNKVGDGDQIKRILLKLRFNLVI